MGTYTSHEPSCNDGRLEEFRGLLETHSKGRLNPARLAAGPLIQALILSHLDDCGHFLACP